MSPDDASAPPLPYVDRKRRAWVLSLAVPALVGLGQQVLAFLLPAALWANFQLTTANYVEHYRLLRRAALMRRHGLADVPAATACSGA